MESRARLKSSHLGTENFVKICSSDRLGIFVVVIFKLTDGTDRLYIWLGGSMWLDDTSKSSATYFSPPL